MPAGGHLKFWTSFNTEVDWDYLTVEAHHPGDDDWTTLPDLNGHTTEDTGETARPRRGWRELHPQLDHYQTRTGTALLADRLERRWNAATGDSGGWQEWDIDLSAYGGEVELSISYISDWARRASACSSTTSPSRTGPRRRSRRGLDGWTVAGPPAGSGANRRDYA